MGNCLLLKPGLLPWLLLLGDCEPELLGKLFVKARLPDENVERIDDALLSLISGLSCSTPL